MKNEVQLALDELFTEELIPFRLIAHIVAAEGTTYTVRFFDSRLHSMRLSWEGNGSFKAAVRAAVLDRVKRMSPIERYRDRVSRHKQVPLPVCNEWTNEIRVDQRKAS